MSISRSAGYLAVDMGPLRFSSKSENEPADNLTEMMGFGVTGAQEAMAQKKRGFDGQHEKVLDSVATSARTSVEA